MGLTALPQRLAQDPDDSDFSVPSGHLYVSLGLESLDQTDLAPLIGRGCIVF